MRTMRGKYRMRTWIRGHLPWSLLWLAPKGKKDCGNHEWRLIEGTTYGCYHCEAGISHEVPWPAADAAVYSLLALRSTLDVREYRPLDEHEVTLARELAKETIQRLEQALADAGVPMPQDKPEVERPAEPARPAAAKPKRARTPAQPVPRASH